MRIVCPSKAKEPYRDVIIELANRARVQVEFTDDDPQGKCVVLDERGEPVTLDMLSELPPDTTFIVGGPDGTNAKGPKISLGHYTLNHQIAIIVLLDLLFRAKNPDHPYTKH